MDDHRRKAARPGDGHFLGDHRLDAVAHVACELVGAGVGQDLGDAVGERSGARRCGNDAVGQVAGGGSDGNREAGSTGGTGVSGEVLTLTPKETRPWPAIDINYYYDCFTRDKDGGGGERRRRGR